MRRSGNAAGHRAVRHALAGDAGPVPGLVLAGVAAVVAFIVVAAPRALVSADNRATQRALAAAPALDTGALVTAELQAGPGAGGLGAPAIGRLSRSFAAMLPLRRFFPAAGRFAGVSVPALWITDPSGPDGRPEQIGLAYRQALPAHAAVVAGSLPGAPVIRRGTGGKATQIILGVAATRVMATTFGLRVGAVRDVGQVSPAGPRILLRVTAIVAPAAPASAFWQLDPVLAVPEREGPSDSPYWVGGALIGAGELAALGTAYDGVTERAAWFFPLATAPAAGPGGHGGAVPAAADIPRLEAGVAALASGPAIRAAESRAGVPALRDNAVSTSLADGLATFERQWGSTTGAGSVLVLGLFVAGAALLLICCGLAAEAYRTELVALRVRGASLGQVGRRMAVRSACIVIPALAAGGAAAVAVLPRSAPGPAGTLLAALTAVTAAGGLPVICVLEHRRLRLAGTARLAEAVTGRTPARRLVAEAAVLLVAAAALADVRLRGAGPAVGRAGTTGPYLSASAVLVAAAIALLLNRGYRGPLRALARAASAGRGAVGAVGLNRAARSRSASVLPAIAVMLGLTLTVFGVMVLGSISTGQVAGSWSRTGADATISAAGTATVTGADLRAIRRVSGVTHAVAVFAGRASGTYAATLLYESESRQVGIAVVEPRSYAALSAATPFGAFPAGALARHGRQPGGRVPVLVTPGLAAQVGGAQLELEDGGVTMHVTIAGTIAQTPAMPGGGGFVVLPRWASARLGGLSQPTTVLVTGQAISVRALRSAAARVLPGGRLVLRRQVLRALDSAPALRVSQRLYLAAAIVAGVLTALAVLFAVAASARPRSALLSRLAALGMARSQALLVGMTEAVPMIAVAAAGAAASVWLLAAVIGPVLGLNTFTGSVQPLALRPTWPELVLPLAGAAVLAVALLAADGVRSGRSGLAAALRQEEVR